MNRQLTITSTAGLLAIHIAFLCAVPVYALLLPVVAHSAKPTPGLPAFMPYLLPLVALVEIPLGFIIPWFATAPKPGDAEKDMTADTRRTTALILSDSAFEAIAIYGLVGVFLSTPTWLCYAMMGMSFIVLLANTLRLRTRTA